jgi:hypothetical protein
MRQAKVMKNRVLSSLLLAALLTLAIACMKAPTTNQPAMNAPETTAAALPPELKAGLESISSNDIMQHTKVLSSDEYEGRGPGTKGEELTVKYLTEQFQNLGLKPGNPDGTYVQKVPLVGFTAQPTASEPRRSV